MSTQDNNITLKEYVDLRFVEQEKAVQAALNAAQKAVDAALSAAEKAKDAALNSAEKATEKALVAMEYRLAGLNEFRESLNDAVKRTMTREESQARFVTIDTKIDAIKSEQDNKAGRSVGLSAGWGILLGAVGLIGTLISIVMWVAKHN